MNYEGKPGTASPQMAEGKKIADITYQMPSSHQFTSQGNGTDGSTSTGTVTLAKDARRSPSASTAKTQKALSKTRRWFTCGSKRSCYRFAPGI